MRLPLPRLSKQQWAYIAGLIDGEGTVSLFKSDPKHNRGSHTLQISIVNTYKPVLDWVKLHLGGYITTRSRKNVKWRTAYQWKLYHRQASGALRRMLPYLIIKKRQARLAIRFSKRLSRGRFLGNVGLPKYEIRIRESIADEIRLTNRRGAA